MLATCGQVGGGAWRLGAHALTWVLVADSRFRSRTMGHTATLQAPCLTAMCTSPARCREVLVTFCLVPCMDGN